ncbi:uncharacterized protein LOC123700660 [Colias croceus]|uniref:uncharacterized protein LOC123700660 n=1 Tax=Colias crocea TaxID=72248 RepID=UPI001E27CA2D|nr:uncharacterized protein LOC123700660 [Colias croceus]
MINEVLQVTSFDKEHKISSDKISSPSIKGKPTPVDFDTFVPWICLEFQVPYNITVHRKHQDEYSRHKRHSHKGSRKLEHPLHESTRKALAIKVFSKNTKPDDDDSIPVTASYNSKGHLTEIAIVNSPYEIPRKLIIAFTLCLPFHNSLGRITIIKDKINFAVIHEISKLLPHSNITQVFLENCDSGAKYHLLLEHLSQLRNLTLRRLGIDDDECKNIVDKLGVGKPASKTLLTLDLSSNKLTDEAAHAFGYMLRGNRCLLHLNLCNNKISDIGADCILKSLTSFLVTDNEILDKKRRRFEYLVKRIAFYKQYKNELILRQTQKESNKGKKHIMPHKKGHLKKSKTEPSFSIMSNLTIDELAEKMTLDNIGEFIDAFDEENLVIVHDQKFSIGNLRLCSLNLSYNNLSYITVRKIYEVLNYQIKVLPKKLHLNTGLMRILFEGNSTPRYCQEYKDICLLLDKVISENVTLPDLSHSTPSLKGRRDSTPSVKRSGHGSAHAKK